MKKKAKLYRLPEYCPRCGEPYDSELFHRNTSYCKICLKEIIDEKKKRVESGEIIEQVPNTPGEYKHQQDFENVKTFLEKIGWIYDKDSNKFYKPGLKEKDGSWNKELIAPRKISGMRKVTFDIVENILKLRKEGYKYQEITKITGLNTTSVWRIIKRNYGIQKTESV